MEKKLNLITLVMLFSISLYSCSVKKDLNHLDNEELYYFKSKSVLKSNSKNIKILNSFIAYDNSSKISKKQSIDNCNLYLKIHQIDNAECYFVHSKLTNKVINSLD